MICRSTATLSAFRHTVGEKRTCSFRLACARCSVKLKALFMLQPHALVVAAVASAPRWDGIGVARHSACEFFQCLPSCGWSLCRGRSLIASMPFHGVYSFAQDCELYVSHKRWPPCFAGTAALVGASACIVLVHLSGHPTGPSPCAHGCASSMSLPPAVDAKRIPPTGLIYRGFVRITCHIDKG